MEYSYTDPQI